MKPKRIQRKRSKGWKMPPNTVYVGRPTKWGNPYKIGDRIFTGADIEDAAHAVSCFRAFIEGQQPDTKELRGKDLACWCSLDQPCHADVLLKIANQ